jgi:Domain of unknown function (DUF4440)
MPAAILYTLVSLAGPPRAFSRSDGPITEQELVARTQALFDALVSGNREPWNKYFADDAIYFDEKGRNMSKSALISDIKPLPTGYSGKIKIGKVESRFLRDTVVLSYELAESETIFGQNVTARYHETDTWIQRDGLWQIIAAQAFRYYEDPALGKVDPAMLPRFTGTYELAPGQVRHLLLEDGKLFLERNGKREELLPESCDIFFRKGVEGRILFRTDSGKVEALIDRRNNEDIIWRKTG